MTTNVSNAEFVFPASFSQQRLWFLNSLAPGNPFYNVSAAIRATGHLNITVLEQTFNEIVRRHEVLRTIFEMTEGQLNQVIVEDVTLSLSVVDLGYLPATEREAAARQQAIAKSQYPFDLTADILLRVTVFQLDSTDHILLLNLHHIIADGWSIGVLIREMSTLYAAFNFSKPSPLPELPIQYADFAHWQREWLQGEVLELQLSYWRSQLANLPLLNLPTDRTRPAVQTYRGATHTLEVSKSLTTSLEALGQQAGVTLFMTLLAAFQTLLHRYTGQLDIVVGSPIANRNRAELEPLIGFFVNSLVLRTDLSGNPTFRELLEQVREVTLGAYAHQDLPFEKLVQELHPARDLSRHPLFSVAIALQNTPITALELPGLALSQFDVDSATSRLDLELHLWQTPAGLQGQVIYSTDLFDSNTITRMLGHFQTLLAGIVADPEQKLIKLPILTAAERQQLLVEWNNTEKDYSCNQCIHELFEAQVNKTPEATALVYQDEQLTYKELNDRSNQLAHYLQKLGVVPEAKVGICVERSLLMVVGILGILKAGGAYVPLDPIYPSERLKFILEDAQVSILLTQQSLAPLLTQQSLALLFKGGWGDQQLIYLDCDSEALLPSADRVIAQQSQENTISSVTEANLAYVIYTSGSTGQPKGVLIEHRGLSNLVQAQIQIFDLKPEHRILQFASLSFDASIFEIVMALGIGATLYIVPEEARYGAALSSYLRQHAITHATLPPAVLKTLPATELPVQTLISAGEACSPEIVARWAGVRRFFNAYGLTETTVWSTVAQLNNSSSTSIGKAIANTQIYVLDPHLQPVAIGIPGELYISGVGLARGYLNRPDLTAARFIPNPFKENNCLSPASRLYKTGDLVCYLPDGNLQFLSRLDYQVKIRGYRIELAEIESLLSQHPAVQEAVVIATEDIPDNKLVAYVVFNADLTLTTAELRRFLAEKLPNYMIPSTFEVQSLPLTPSGKVDRNALKKFKINILRPYVAPRTETEYALTILWAKLLNLEQIGIQDNFFELGGDSLLAMQLLEQVNQCEQNLPLSNLFLAPTVEQFAALIENRNPDSNDSPLPWSPLVPLQPAGSKPPFFCVHPIFGVVLPYYELAFHLGKDQPFYGLQPFGIDGSHPPLTTIEEMADCYIKALRQVQPRGPYYLGGWSFGGLVAFEMGQQLHRSGEQVFLAIIDTLAPVSSNQLSFWDGLKFLLTTVSRSIYPFLLDYWSLISDRFSNKSISISAQKITTPHTWLSFLERATVKYLIPQETRLRMLDELTLARMLKIFYANSRATLKYMPPQYPNALALFRTNEQLSKSDDPTLGWNQLTTSNVQVHCIPGNHLTMLRKPHVQVLAKYLCKYLGAE
ncbi:MAG: amino acid adenylation domain-containing protein [Gloeocapsa sp. UFS-A4-WI-NPMV-4B04]|nr:amino acid adenylation domain-containing protein [Gloeocapsa sp. UFS-A4-WI-NPMV-4B04]